MIIDQHIIGCVDCPGEGKSAAADEPGLAEFAGGQLPADAQCRRAGNSAAPPSALGYFRDRGLCAWTLRGLLLRCLRDPDRRGGYLSNKADKRTTDL